MASRSKRLRSGYTTGACAAAAAKAATMLLLSTAARVKGSKGQRVKNFDTMTDTIGIPFPDGSRHKFRIRKSEYRSQNKTAYASVIKDAGDDPDVTNGAEIVAEVRMQDTGYRIQDKKNRASCIMHHTSLLIKGGSGVGVITKPGLSIPVGEPAINPVPRKMIREAVLEAVQGFKGSRVQGLEIIISVTNGEKLAKKTLNERLGILGGISILGTTGIVKPVSSEAWTATIASSMDVAKAMGYDKIVLSAGRTSEKAHMEKFNFPEESYVMMGDYLEFSLLEAKKHGFKKIHLCAQWAKMLKIAMATPQTHVRHGAIDLKKAVEFLRSLQPSALSPRRVARGDSPRPFNTAMEIYDFISPQLATHNSKLFRKVCLAAKKYAEGIAEGIPVAVHLVSYGGEVIAGSE